MQVMFKIMEREWSHKIEGAFGRKRWKHCALLEDTVGCAGFFPMRIAKNKREEEVD